MQTSSDDASIEEAYSSAALADVMSALSALCQSASGSLSFDERFDELLLSALDASLLSCGIGRERREEEALVTARVIEQALPEAAIGAEMLELANLLRAEARAIRHGEPRGIANRRQEVASFVTRHVPEWIEQLLETTRQARRLDRSATFARIALSVFASEAFFNHVATSSELEGARTA